MFERFTDRARKTMALANQEAWRLGHEQLGTEHILLGLVKEGGGVGANVLKNLDVDLRKVRQEVEKLVTPGLETVTMGRLPQTPGAKKIIEYAIEEARQLNHNYVGTEHLLLALLREQDGVAGLVLMNLGITLGGVREEVLNLLGEGEASTLDAKLEQLLKLPTDLIAGALTAGKIFLEAQIVDLEGDDLLATPGPKVGKHVLWVLGHLAWAEERLIACYVQGGRHPHPEWEPLFGTGSQPVPEAAQYPSKAELWQRFLDVRVNTFAARASLVPEDLARPSFAKDIEHLGTIGKCFMAVISHNAFHCGQIADIRRALGRKPVVG